MSNLAPCRLLILLLLAFAGRLFAAEGGPKSSGFRELVEARERDTLRAVATYIEQHPEADDLEQAYTWLFDAAAEAGLEAEAIGAAEKFLSRRDADQAARTAAQQVLCLGLARGGKLDEAVGVYETLLTGARFQSPFKTLDLAGSLAAQARLAGKLDVSRQIYERMAQAYPLNAQIDDIVTGRIARQELIGQPVPSLELTDIDRKPVTAADFSGKVVLVDFWATNCAPCLAEFPNLRAIYKELQPRGLEILGISFDPAPEIVEAYRTRAKLPWRMVMNESPQGTVSDRFRTRTIPALFLIGRDGKVAQVDVRGRDLRQAIEQLLEAK